MQIRYILIIILFSPIRLISQIGLANHYPTLKPHHILDENKEDISFAFSMRILESDVDYLIRLRRDSDDAEQDFGCNEDDLLDVTAINTWAGASTLYVVTWYDQSGQGRNAVQTDPDKQPVFTPDTTFPYFNSDDVEDFLVVETSTLTLTNNGKNGTVIGVFYATDNNNHTFGTRQRTNGGNRWLAHFNWSDNNLYFDPSNVNGSRNIGNTVNIDVWNQYSLIRRDDPGNPATDRRIFRINNTEIQNLGYNDAFQHTGDYYFGIGATIASTITSANPYDTFQHSTTRFCEFIMYAEGKDDSFLNEIEENQITYWNL